MIVLPRRAFIPHPGLPHRRPFFFLLFLKFPDRRPSIGVFSILLANASYRCCVCLYILNVTRDRELSDGKGKERRRIQDYVYVSCSSDVRFRSSITTIDDSSICPCDEHGGRSYVCLAFSIVQNCPKSNKSNVRGRVVVIGETHDTDRGTIPTVITRS